MTDFEAFCTYLAIKNHFTKKSYDYFKYSGKVTAKKESFYKRKDRFFFEKLSRSKTKEQIVDYFVANYVESSDSAKVWVGDLKTIGEGNYNKWLNRKNSLEDTFTEDLKKIIEDNHLLDAIISDKNKHPLILKLLLKKEISVETFIIIDDLLFFTKNLKDDDIIWKGIKLLVTKYRPFFHYDKTNFVRIIKMQCLTKN
jgi:hypothetical protein